MFCYTKWNKVVKVLDSFPHSLSCLAALQELPVQTGPHQHVVDTGRL